jgi:hypothetical protein
MLITATRAETARGLALGYRRDDHRRTADGNVTLRQLRGHSVDDDHHHGYRRRGSHGGGGQLGKLAADSISIRNVGGFTGSYWRDLGKDADVSMAGTTLTVSGTADGYRVDNPSFRTTGSFKFKASC